MSNGRALVAGIGNMFLGDDGFGVEVARHLAERRLGESVQVVDFGIRGIDLVYALLDGYEQVILIDAAPRGKPPGTLYVIEPLIPDTRESPPPSFDVHSLVPSQVLASVRAMGGTLGRIRIVGCEPAAIPEDEDLVVGLSHQVAAAVPAAAELVEELLGQ